MYEDPMLRGLEITPIWGKGNHTGSGRGHEE